MTQQAHTVRVKTTALYHENVDLKEQLADKEEEFKELHQDYIHRIKAGGAPSISWQNVVLKSVYVYMVYDLYMLNILRLCIHA